MKKDRLVHAEVRLKVLDHAFRFAREITQTAATEAERAAGREVAQSFEMGLEHWREVVTKLKEEG